MDDYTLAIARILKREQQRPGQPSYTKLAEITGLSRPTVERLLNGRRDITLRYLRALCEALGVDPAQVVDEAEATLTD
ncbi:MAG: Cro/C1-type DNA-binding domain [Microbacterium sp.]|nr:Cro/C1-type DNA-binding domain [Microbacterium sp.]